MDNNILIYAGYDLSVPGEWTFVCWRYMSKRRTNYEDLGECLSRMIYEEEEFLSSPESILCDGIEIFSSQELSEIYCSKLWEDML